MITPPPLRRLTLILAGGLAALPALPCMAAAPATHAQVTILGTTDVHGHIYPTDYYTDRPAPLGLAKIATMIETARIGAPHLILVDSGDTIQGSPLEYYHNRVDNAPVDPMMLVMNYLHYDAMAVGNHDYNYGLAVQTKAHGEARFPWLSANTYRVGASDPAFQPYIIRVVDGVRVGVLGLTTPDIPYWDDASDYAGLEFRPSVAEARKWVAILRGKEHADVVVIAMHMGIDRDLGTGNPLPQLPNENGAIAIAMEVPGVDVIFMGHTHKDVPSLTVNGVLLTQAYLWGQRLARADLYLSRVPGGPWTVWAKSATTIPVTARTEADPEVLRLASDSHKATQEWLERKIGTSAAELAEEDAQIRDNAIMNLVQRAELDTGKADVAFASPLNLAARIHKGPVSVRDLYGIYVYDNSMVVVELTGAQLKAALEHSAVRFRPYQPGKSASELLDSNRWPYDFDTAAGVTYVMDLRRPLGDRIRDLKYQGAPIDPNRKFRVATTNYRVNGGGGFTMIKAAPVLYRSADEIRNLMIEWVERHHDIPTEPMNNWHIIPAP